MFSESVQVESDSVGLPAPSVRRMRISSSHLLHKRRFIHVEVVMGSISATRVEDAAVANN